MQFSFFPLWEIILHHIMSSTQVLSAYVLSLYCKYKLLMSVYGFSLYTGLP